MKSVMAKKGRDGVRHKSGRQTDEPRSGSRKSMESMGDADADRFAILTEIDLLGGRLDRSTVINTDIIAASSGPVPQCKTSTSSPIGLGSRPVGSEEPSRPVPRFSEPSGRNTERPDLGFVNGVPSSGSVVSAESGPEEVSYRPIPSDVCVPSQSVTSDS